MTEGTDLFANCSILCVDDEETILAAYRDALVQPATELGDSDDVLFSRRERRKGADPGVVKTEIQQPSYKVFSASSGEEAVRIIESELASGRQIAAGFFDVVMPGGMDGIETIKRILELDSQMLCAVVTAYTDRSPDQMSGIFRRQNDWLYFNKPFSIGEVRQTACHLVTTWNQRRREEALIGNLETVQNGLIHILDMVNDISRVPPLVLSTLLEGILKHFLKLADGCDGFAALQSGEKELILAGTGAFEKDLHGKSLTRPELERKFPIVGEAASRKTSVLWGEMAATPLRIGGDVLGVLVVRMDCRANQNPHLLDTYGVQAVNLIEHSKLYEELDQRNLELSEKNQELVDLLGKLSQSEKLRTEFERLSCIDGLTGMANRRHLESQIVEELARSTRHGSAMACAMVDVDHFKNTNDTYGHAAGDYVLRELGRILVTCKRPYDVAGRYGGEEFVLLLKHIDAEDSMAVCERIRSAIEEHVFFFEGNRLSITVSIGVSWVAPSPENVLKVVLSEADQALYRAKSDGRNRCVRFFSDKL